MKDWQTHLRDGDPGAQAFLPADDAAAMRRAVLASVPSQARAPRLWMQPLLVAATIALMIGTGALAGRRAASQAPDQVAAGAIQEAGGETRQLQFATPGGTRIIWTFNSEFDLP